MTSSSAKHCGFEGNQKTAGKQVKKRGKIWTVENHENKLWFRVSVVSCRATKNENGCVAKSVRVSLVFFLFAKSVVLISKIQKKYDF